MVSGTNVVRMNHLQWVYKYLTNRFLVFKMLVFEFTL